MDSTGYPYLNTRLAMFSSRRLSPAVLSRLVDEPIDTVEATAQLAGLKELADQGGTDTSHLEQVLLSRLLADTEVLLRPLQGGDRRFVRFCAQWFELGNLKALVRGKLSSLPDTEIRRQLVDTTPFTTLPIDDLLRTEDPAEMLRRLETTTYGDVARQARLVYEEKKDLFSLDAAIDRRFFIALQRRADNVHRSQRAAVRRLVGTVVDRFDLLWLLRYRFSYGISPAETYYLLVPAGRGLSAAALLSLSQLGSLEEVLNALPPRLREHLAGAATITEVENRLEALTYQVMRGAIGDIRNPIGRCFALFVLRDMEMRQLLALLKGRKLGLPAELIRFATALTVH